MELQEYHDTLFKALKEKGDPDRAIQQMKYMKDHFDFIGLKAQEWMDILRWHYKTYGYPEDSDIAAFSEMCYSSAYREMHYVGLETVQRRLKPQPTEFIDQLEWLIVTNSWWDTVDWLAGLAGTHFKRYPELQPATTDRWNNSDNMWLNRVSIIFQLKYKEETDFDLMSRYILKHAKRKEFFIRKAQGWALRQHAKYQPKEVRQFVNDHPELSSLTKKEALKHLKDQPE